MMSTVSVELTNFINPDLTWKTVSKGSRSGTRRTRKSISRKLAVEMVQGSKNATTAVDAAVSESEKVGVAILGRRFSEKIEQVPIKKRRIEYLSSSPPPPQTPSPHPELSEQHAHDQSTSDESLFNTSWGRGPSKVGELSVDVNDMNFLSMPGKKCGVVEDFSGMEILAAAACSDSIGHDDVQSKSNSLMSESIQEHTDSLISETLVETACASLQLDQPSAKTSTNESRFELSSSPCNTNTVPKESACDKKSVESSVSLPEDRSLWDLNLTIDAWEKPCTCDDDGSEKNSDEDLSDGIKNCLVAEPNDVKINSTLMMGSSTNDAKCVHSRILCAGIDGLNGETKEVKESCAPKRERDEPVLAVSDQVKTSVRFKAGCIDVPTDVSKVDQCLNQSLLPQSDVAFLRENRKLSSSTGNTELDIKDESSMVGVDQICYVESKPAKEIEASKPAEGISHDANNEDCGDAGPFDVKASAQVDNFQPDVTVGVKPENEVVGVDTCHAPPKCDFPDIASPGAQKDGAGETVLPSPVHAAETVYSKTGDQESLLKSHENMIDSSGLCEFATHEESSAKLDMVSTGVSHTVSACQDPVVLGGVGESLELQAGYDSQFEDGELREPDVQLWDDIEQVDYDTEGEEERLSAKQSDTSEKKLDIESGSNAASADRVLKNGNTEGASLNLKVDNGNVAESSRIKGDSVHAMDGLNARSSDLRLDGLKASPNVVRRSRSSNFDDSYHSAERDGYSDRYVERERAGLRLCGRSPGNGRIFNRSTVHWNSKQHSPVHQDPYNSVRLRPRSGVESHEFVMATDGELAEAAGVARTGQRIGRQFFHSSNGVYRPHMRRRSPLARDDSYGMHTRMTTIRESNPDRSMFRRYTQHSSRPGRDEYLKHIADSTEYFGRVTHRLGRRERSGSPNGGRPHYAPYRGSRSRSRSRSPMPWLHQRDRNDGSSHRSRSPNFKSDAARMDRVRLMFPKRFASDYKEGGFVPAARSRVSPPHNNRLFEERNTDFDHFRSRKSPVRMFRQTQRFDSVRSSRSPSPMPWLHQRERNEGSSHRSRSPNFKSDGARMDRVRSMFPKRFTSDYKDGFMSAGRSRVSPLRTNRPFEDRNTDFDDFRSRTSPVRMFRQNQRFDSGRSSRRLDTDDHFRLIRPRRFPDMAASCKSGKYEGGEDDKHGGARYEANRGRHCETDGSVRRFQYNNDEEAIVEDECIPVRVTQPV